MGKRGGGEGEREGGGGEGNLREGDILHAIWNLREIKTTGFQRTETTSLQRTETTGLH